MWWPISAIPALRKLRQKGCCEYEASLGYTVRSWFMVRLNYIVGPVSKKDKR